MKQITIFDQNIQRKWHVADFSEAELASAVRRAVEDGAMETRGYISEEDQLTKPIAMYDGNSRKLVITYF